MREIRERLRSKGFLISTAVLLIAVTAAAIMVNVIGGEPGPSYVAVGVSSTAAFDTADGDAAGHEALRSALAAPGDDIEPTVTIVDDPTEALESGEIDVHFDGATLTWHRQESPGINQALRQRIYQGVFGQRADALGLEPGQVGPLFAPVKIESKSIAGDDEQRGMRIAASMVAAAGLFFMLQGWGGQIMMGVVEEKQSRVVEVLLSQLRPRTLLAGKVIGIGFLALIQTLIIGAGLVLALSLASDIEVPEGVWSTIPLALVTFLFGFAFYGSAFAGVGATATRTEDIQSAQLPAFIPLLSAYMIAAMSLANPTNLVVAIGSFVPFTSPILLPFLNAHDPLPWYWIAGSLTILAGSTIAMIRLGGWVYRRSLLRTSSRMSLTELWRDRRSGTDLA